MTELLTYARDLANTFMGQLQGTGCLSGPQAESKGVQPRSQLTAAQCHKEVVLQELLHYFKMLAGDGGLRYDSLGHATGYSAKAKHLEDDQETAREWIRIVKPKFGPVNSQQSSLKPNHAQETMVLKGITIIKSICDTSYKLIKNLATGLNPIQGSMGRPYKSNSTRVIENNKNETKDPKKNVKPEHSDQIFEDATSYPVLDLTNIRMTVVSPPSQPHYFPNSNNFLTYRNSNEDEAKAVEVVLMTTAHLREGPGTIGEYKTHNEGHQKELGQVSTTQFYQGADHYPTGTHSGALASEDISLPLGTSNPSNWY